MTPSFESMWADLAPIGKSAGSGGYRRYAWSPAERECREWFHDQAQARELILAADGNGNEVAWWFPAGGGSATSAMGGIVTGSHLDSVPDGGAYDGPLGVVSAFAAIDALRAGGVAPTRPLGVAAFSDEEGARFGIACLGSRLLVGAIDADRAAALVGADGTTLPAAMRAAGFDHQLGESDLLGGVAAFVELHVEQGRSLVDTGVPVGIATEIWPHGRWRFDIGGEANHAGTTRLQDRHDPMLTYAELVLAARKKARQAGAVATFGRLEVTPNATNAIPSGVRAWLDARGPDESTVDSLIAELSEHAGARAERDGTSLAVTAESVSPAASFAGPLTDRVRGILPGAPLLPTGAGHDAGILAAAGIATAMLFVRNPTGVSHAPAEYADDADCLAGIDALAAVLQDLAC